MALAYTEAPTVAKGAAITSSQWNKLCDSINDRLAQGVGDVSWRLHWFWHSLFRNARNTDASGQLYAPEDEWWKFTSHVDVADYQYPATSGPGQPEGASLANPLNGFVFGNPTREIKSEAGRLNYDGADGRGVLLHDTAGNPSTDSRKWNVGQEQRGAVLATDTGDVSYANALFAAQAHLRFGFGPFYERTYGGFIAGPQYTGQCSAPNDDLNDFQLKFTNTSTNPHTITYYSTCPGATGVYSYYRGAKSYVLLMWQEQSNGSNIIELPLDTYVEGPYDDNAYLKHPPGEQLSRALNYFVQPFRGSAADQLSSSYKVQDKAFDFDRFFKSQYFLAPARGVTNSSGGIDAVYNVFNFDPSTAANSLGTLNATSSTSFATATDFCLAGVLAKRHSGTGEKRFEVLVDGAVVTTLTLPNGVDSQSAWFEEPHNGTVSVRCLDAMASGDDCEVQAAELLEMKPSHEDIYLLLRMGSASTAALQRIGEEQPSPKDISDDYFNHGMVYNASVSEVPDDLVHLNTNPVYRAVSEEVRKRLRMADRLSIVGYEVNGDGNSVLYFKRQANPALVEADVFEGIGPSLAPITSGSLIAGRTYKVVGGSSVTYNGSTVNTGSTFTAVEGVDTYTKAGSEEVYENEGIRAEAEPAGYDNRWLMHMESMSYAPSNSNTFKLNSYTDIIGYKHDRCAFMSPEWTSPGNGEIFAHVQRSAKGNLIASESPPGYRYILGTHTPGSGYDTSTLIGQANGDGTTNNLDCQPSLEAEGNEGNCTGMKSHWKACKIYRPDYQIESAERVEPPANSGELARLKVTLNTRLEHNEDAPGSVSDSAASRASYLSNDYTGATNGGWRSDENAVIEYLRTFVDGSSTQCGHRIGDVAPGVAYSNSYEGACVPRFFFTRLMPKVYEDNNSVYDLTDTLMKTEELTWAETILKAVCGGFIDSKSTVKQLESTDPVTGLAVCDDKRLYDYTFESLMLQATAPNSQSSQEPPATPHFRALTNDLRTDQVKSFGPLPGQLAYADHFNQIAKAVNLLTRARLYLPLSYRRRFIFYESYESLVGKVRAKQGATVDCGNGAVWADNIESVPTWVYDRTGAWAEFSTPADVAEKYCRIDQDNAGNCVLKCVRKDLEFTVGLNDFAYEAMNSDLRTLVETTSSVGFAVADGQNTVIHEKRNDLGTQYSGNGGVSDYYHDNSTTWDWQSQSDPSGNIGYYNECRVTNGGTIIADPVPVSDYVDTEATNRGRRAESNRSIYAGSAQAFVTVPLVT